MTYPRFVIKSYWNCWKTKIKIFCLINHSGISKIESRPSSSWKIAEPEWVLIYLKASRDVLWRRVQERGAKKRDADSAYDVTAEVLDHYLEGFEAPEGEGEVVFEVT